jgi:hypothetical protein
LHIDIYLSVIRLSSKPVITETTRKRTFINLEGIIELNPSIGLKNCNRISIKGNRKKKNSHAFKNCLVLFE